MGERHFLLCFDGRGSGEGHTVCPMDLPRGYHDRSSNQLKKLKKPFLARYDVAR